MSAVILMQNFANFEVRVHFYFLRWICVYKCKLKETDFFFLLYNVVLLWFFKEQ